MIVIGVTGMPGSGKSVVARIANDLGFKIVRMGDVIRDEAKRRNEKSGKVAVDLRIEFGKTVIADRCVEVIKSDKDFDHTNYIIEGIRSPYEVDIFQDNFPGFKVIAVHSSPKTRFERLKNRRRSDDSSDLPQFVERDLRELDFGIGNVIATSDFMLVNEGPLWKFKKIIRSILQNEIKGNSQSSSQSN